MKPTPVLQKPLRPHANPSRRALVGATWAAPAVVAVTAAPALATSPPCPEVRPQGSAYASIYFTNLNVRGGRGYWTNRSTAQVVFNLGVPSPAVRPSGQGGLNFSTDTAGVQTILTGYSRTITTNLNLSFSQVSGWRITSGTAPGGRYVYTFTYDGDPITKTATAPLGSTLSARSSSNTFPLTNFPVTLNRSAFYVGQHVSVGVTYTVRAEDSISVDVITDRQACNGPQTFTGEFTFDLDPLSSRPFNASAAEQPEDFEDAVSSDQTVAESGSAFGEGFNSSAHS